MHLKKKHNEVTRSSSGPPPQRSHTKNDRRRKGKLPRKPQLTKQHVSSLNKSGCNFTKQAMAVREILVTVIKQVEQKSSKGNVPSHIIADASAELGCMCAIHDAHGQPTDCETTPFKRLPTGTFNEKDSLEVCKLAEVSCDNSQTMLEIATEMQT